MILLLDNYDSFTYNIVHAVASLGEPVVVHRNREISVADALALRPDGIILSPGPSRPENTGILCDLIRAGMTARIPMFGICLGHQAIGYVLGAKVVRAQTIMHGKISEITHDGQGIFKDMPSPFRAVRYHSLALERASLPPELHVTATTADGEIMGMRHTTLPIESVQYHPESIMTSGGKQQFVNFINLVNHTKGATQC